MVTLNTKIHTAPFNASQIICVRDGAAIKLQQLVFSLNQLNTIHKQVTTINDRLGSVRQILDIYANVKARYTYDPFGNTFDTETEEPTFANPFRYTGQYFDKEINQYYLRARMYNPHLAIFTTRDPADGKFEQPLTLHKYLYVNNNPINFYDPAGLWAFFISGGFQFDAIIGKSVQRGLVFDGEGDLGVITTTSTGLVLGSPSASFGVTFGLSADAADIDAMKGPGYSYGFAGGTGFGSIGGDYFWGKDASGYSTTVGGTTSGLGWPHANVHGMITNTTVERIIPGWPGTEITDLLGATGRNLKLDYQLFQQGLRGRLQAVEQMLDEQFWGIRSQGEAYQLYMAYGMLDMISDQ